MILFPPDQGRQNYYSFSFSLFFYFFLRLSPAVLFDVNIYFFDFITYEAGFKIYLKFLPIGYKI